MWRDARFIAGRDLAIMLRTRETILWVFVMPVVFFYFMGTVTAGFGKPDNGRPDPIAIHGAEGGGFLVDELTRRLGDQHFVVAHAASPQDFADHTRRLTLPPPPSGHANLTASMLAGHPAVLSFERDGEELERRYDELRVARAVYTVLADLVTTSLFEDEASPETFADLAAAPRRVTLHVSSAGKRERPPTGYSQAIPGTMVMFTMLVLLTSGAILLVIEREQGLLRRLASTPIRPASVVAGKWMARMVLGLVQLAFAMLAGSVFFQMEWGASIWMVGVTLIAWAGFNASFGLLLANIVRSQAQMLGVGVLVTMTLASLGGCWWPIEITPEWMQTLAACLPTGWTMDALHKLVNFGYGPAAAAPHLAALLTGTLVCGVVAARTFRYQ